MEEYNRWLKFPRDTLGISTSAGSPAKKQVWIPHKEKGFASGEVIKEEGGKVVVFTEEGEVTLKESDVHAMNPAKFDGVDDCAELGYLSEPTVFHNLKKRYDRDIIYTYSGLFLVAVNPYHTVPIYTQDIIDIYRGKRRTSVPSHFRYFRYSLQSND